MTVLFTATALLIVAGFILTIVAAAKPTVPLWPAVLIAFVVLLLQVFPK